MNKKNKSDKRGFVFSTDPQFRFETEETGEKETLPPAQQPLRVRLETSTAAAKPLRSLPALPERNPIWKPWANR
jgi:translation initiation factor 1